MVKERIKYIYYDDEGRETYGYRTMWGAVRDEGIYLAQEIVRKLM